MRLRSQTEKITGCALVEEVKSNRFVTDRTKVLNLVLWNIKQRNPEPFFSVAVGKAVTVYCVMVRIRNCKR
jgi:hypothetical protein